MFALAFAHLLPRTLQQALHLHPCHVGAGGGDEIRNLGEGERALPHLQRHHQLVHHDVDIHLAQRSSTSRCARSVDLHVWEKRAGGILDWLPQHLLEKTLGVSRNH